MSVLQRIACRRQPCGWILLRHQRAATVLRPLSSMAMNTNTTIVSSAHQPPPTTTTTIKSSSAIPFVHSRKKLAPACVDAGELHDMTEHVLTTEAGNLFQFNRRSSPHFLHGEDRQDAWAVSDGTVQMVEYLMRGHAARVPGTLWEGWTNKGNACSSSGGSDDAIEALETMDKLVGRMWDEGSFYMQVRKEHLSQLAWEEDLKVAEDPVSKDWRAFAMEGTTVDDSEDDDSESEDETEDGANKSGDREEGEEASEDTTEDFAMPGPTVAMFDIFLDTLAVTAAVIRPQEISGREASNLLTARNAFDTFELILYRHKLDGDDEFNDNIHTMPTQISYNAVIRAMANLPYDTASEVQRDWALMTAFAVHDAMTHSALERNSSTYAYLLQVLKKYMPPCTSRGNIAHGLWKLAKSSGVYNGQVQEAYLQAHEPSNSPEHDGFLDKFIRGKDWRTDSPQRWRRRVQKYRTIPRQTTY